MLKTAQELDKEIDQLNELLSGRVEKTPIKSGTYTSPVRVSNTGKVLDGDEKPSIIGGFIIEDKVINPMHLHGHPAVDFQAPKGTSAYPIGPGKVYQTTTEGSNPKGGNAVFVAHTADPALVSYYAHFDKIVVSVGQEVDQSTVIGLVGNTGSAKYTSAHCHCSTKINGQYVDPMSVIGKPFGFTHSEKTKTPPTISLAALIEEFIKII